MEFDYIYADLQVTVTVKADNTSAFGQLNDRETQALQQLIYMTLNAFHFTRGLYLLPQYDPHKYNYLKDEGSDDDG